MSVVAIDKTLVPNQLNTSKDERLDCFLNNIKKEADIKYVLNNFNGDIYHLNYLEYLNLAWSNHYGIIFSPDILWYTLLCELTLIIKETPEKFRYLFTDSEDKKEIIVETDDLVVIPIHLIMGQLQDLVPNVDLFTPSFTTTTDRSKDAQRAAFADLVSPYYNYMMFMCGIPYVKVLGTKEDYLEIKNCWDSIGELLKVHKKYFSKVSKILNNIIQNLENSDFWKKMFYNERCGSGSQYEIFGWFTDLFKETSDIRFVTNFSTHASNVEYKNLSTNKDFKMKQGLFSSTLEDEFLVPDFGYTVFEKVR